MPGPDAHDTDWAPLFSMAAETRAPRLVADTPRGGVAVIDVTGGSFEGPRLAGHILPSGGDWLSLGASAPRLDVRLLLETDDGVPVLMRYTGVALAETDGHRAIVSAMFDAPAGTHGWLNDILAVGFSSGPGRYDFYQIL